ncbi:hypothetical protein KY333_03215, partial [Candidatus Woesearchaeota archaeon]|nr:hypothetical protein [Candidatus Woesearchaeota archaeon]
MTSRNQAIWGETGQKLINDAKILITGLSITGIEAIKTAAMLGIGTIYLVGDEQGSGFFLEQAMNPAKKQGKQLEKIVNDLRFKSGDLNTTVNVEAVEESYLNNDRLIKQLNPDAIFDFTQDLSSQLQSIEYGIQLSAEKPVEVFLGGCNAQDFTLTHYSPSENDDAEDIADEKEIDRYEGKDQDVTTSHILSSIAIEFFRKRLFNRHKEIISASQKDIKKPHKERGPFRDTLKYSIKHPQASQNIKQQHTNCLRTSMTQEDFSIGCHDAAENLITTLNLDDLPNINTSLEGKTFLVCGCGAIGNPVADMLVRKGAAKIDFMDFDK